MRIRQKRLCIEMIVLTQVVIVCYLTTWTRKSKFPNNILSTVWSNDDKKGSLAKVTVAPPKAEEYKLAFPPSVGPIFPPIHDKKGSSPKVNVTSSITKTLRECPRHYIFHNGMQCPPSTEADFIGTVAPFYVYGYSAFQHRQGNTQIIKIIFYCVFPKTKPKLQCAIQFAGRSTYTKGYASYFSVSTFTYDTNAYGKVHNVLIGCLYPDSEPRRTVATSVRVLVNDTVLTTLPVEKLPRPKKRKSLALCLPRVYNTPYCKNCVGMNYTYHLPEWMEMQRIMGVDTVFVYNQSMSDDASRMFKYYADQGYVEVLSHRPIHNETYMPTSMGVTDCMIRNRFAYDYVIVLDTDEFIFSPKWDTYQEIIAALLHNTPYEQLHFGTSHFYTTGERTPAEGYLNTMSFHKYQYKAYMDGGKSLTNPRQCKRIVIPHECSSMQNQTLKVDPALAMVHHYKVCSIRSHVARRACKQDKNKTWPTTNVAERFHDRLRQAVQKTFHDLKLWGF